MKHCAPNHLLIHKDGALKFEASSYTTHHPVSTDQIWAIQITSFQLPNLQWAITKINFIFKISPGNKIKSGQLFFDEEPIYERTSSDKASNLPKRDACFILLK